MQVDAPVVEADRHADVVEVQQLGALVEQHPLGQACRAAGVHEHGRVVLVGLGRRDGAAGRDEVLVAHVVGCVGVTDEHDVAER